MHYNLYTLSSFKPWGRPIELAVVDLTMCIILLSSSKGIKRELYTSRRYYVSFTDGYKCIRCCTEKADCIKSTEETKVHGVDF